ncbi:hypothetical protein ACJJTC_018552 [Scirpophaga incertulas]
MSLLRCINCDIRVTRIKRHLLANESEALRNVFRVWTYPREATNSDFICQACWELGNAQVTGANSLVNEGKPGGHHNICIGCGRSILKLSSRIILRENRTIDEGPIIDIISSWIHPRQVNPMDFICHACRQLAIDATQQDTEPTKHHIPA